MGLIIVSAVVLQDDAGNILTVRKRGTSRFMLPGGKPEPGESPAHTAARECREELGIQLEPARLELLGAFHSAAANEPGEDLRSTVFWHPSVPGATASAEIDEMRWMPLSDPLPTDLAPMLAGHVIPELHARSAAAPTRSDQPAP